ncbi:allantoate permease, putative [Talaromyces stipitatus ATCC 10500]|uniref:Allantoate permease, putative n=1 Tax=Talaromyces stipitatus (strain ATCC 10500 / CBS 375.48 / QM 6759 / NRRL 1006) TaxID=441959 RepID=B8MG23_TALSN|nr:allantoate permease, putative [Talaromyces stipitatus ATCC 10500]EED15890.1 allantoate permease, putative [Talaromyces stipitatus ATCC 10500]
MDIRAFAVWKAMFLIIGLLTAVYGMFMFFLKAGSPVTTRWLTDEEKRVAIERLRGNQQGICSKVFKGSQFREAFTDIRWNHGLFHGTHRELWFQCVKKTFLLVMPGGLVEVISIVGICYLAKRIENSIFCAVIGRLPGLLGMVLMMDPELVPLH